MIPAAGLGTRFLPANKAMPKERLEVFAAGRALQLDNFRRLNAFGWRTFSGMKLWLALANIGKEKRTKP